MVHAHMEAGTQKINNFCLIMRLKRRTDGTYTKVYVATSMRPNFSRETRHRELRWTQGRNRKDVFFLRAQASGRFMTSGCILLQNRDPAPDGGLADIGRAGRDGPSLRGPSTSQSYLCFFERACIRSLKGILCVASLCTIGFPPLHRKQNCTRVDWNSLREWSAIYQNDLNNQI